MWASRRHEQSVLQKRSLMAKEDVVRSVRVALQGYGRHQLRGWSKRRPRGIVRANQANNDSLIVSCCEVLFQLSGYTSWPVSDVMILISSAVLLSISCSPLPSIVARLRLWSTLCLQGRYSITDKIPKTTNEPHIAPPIISKLSPTVFTPSQNLPLGLATPATGDCSWIVPMHIATMTVIAIKTIE